MLKTIILICPLLMDHAACQIDTATDVIYGPRVKTVQRCQFMGQAMLATTALAPGEKHFAKVACPRVPPKDIAQY